jgi:hypothetical protein
MSVSSFLKTIAQASILTAVAVGILAITQAQVRTSPSYQLQSDSINFGGGLSSSTNYSLESTAGEVATGDGGSATYRLRAGYQQMQEVYLSMTEAADVVMSPSLGGLTGGTSNGSTSVLVLTDSPSGYQLTILAESSPAMRKGFDTIADYVASSSPAADFAFTATATQAHFGFSPQGSDIVSFFKDNGTSCGVGSLDTALSCWKGLTTSEVVIAQGDNNQPSGATTTINFRVGIGANAGVIAGSYIATTTLTAIPL